MLPNSINEAITDCQSLRLVAHSTHRAVSRHLAAELAFVSNAHLAQSLNPGIRNMMHLWHQLRSPDQQCQSVYTVFVVFLTHYLHQCPHTGEQWKQLPLNRPRTRFRVSRTCPMRNVQMQWKLVVKRYPNQHDYHTPERSHKIMFCSDSSGVTRGRRRTAPADTI